MRIPAGYSVPKRGPGSGSYEDGIDGRRSRVDEVRGSALRRAVLAPIWHLSLGQDTHDGATRPHPGSTPICSTSSNQSPVSCCASSPSAIAEGGATKVSGLRRTALRQAGRQVSTHQRHSNYESRRRETDVETPLLRWADPARGGRAGMAYLKVFIRVSIFAPRWRR